MKYLVLLLMLTNCGVTGSVQGGTKNTVVVSGGATITYAVSIDNLIQYFSRACISQLGANATQAEIDTCVNNGIFDLLHTIGSK